MTNKHKGNLLVTIENQNNFKKLEKSGSIYVRENATLTAPKLKISKGIAKFNNRKYKITRKDGILFFIDREKTSKGIKIYLGLIELRLHKNKVTSKKSYLVEKEGFSAHGETLKKAIGDLQFKIVAEKFKSLVTF